MKLCNLCLTVIFVALVLITYEEQADAQSDAQATEKAQMLALKSIVKKQEAEALESKQLLDATSDALRKGREVIRLQDEYIAQLKGLNSRCNESMKQRIELQAGE